MMFLSFRFLSFSSMPCLPIDLNLLYSAVVSMGILCALFPTMATCLWDLCGDLFPFLVSSPLFLSFSPMPYDVPFLSFPASMGILCVLFLAIATCLCPVGEPVPFSRIPLPSLVLVSYDVPCSFPSFSSMPCLPIDLKLLYSAVVSMGILCVLFPTIATCLCPVGEYVPAYFLKARSQFFCFWTEL